MPTKAGSTTRRRCRRLEGQQSPARISAQPLQSICQHVQIRLRIGHWCTRSVLVSATAVRCSFKGVLCRRLDPRASNRACRLDGTIVVQLTPHSPCFARDKSPLAHNEPRLDILNQEMILPQISCEMQQCLSLPMRRLAPSRRVL